MRLAGVLKYRVIGTDPATRRSVSVLSLGAMLMGTRTDEQTSFAILDRFVRAGGNFIDTSGNYAFWVNGTQGGESEELLGRWRRSRGASDSVVIATKVAQGDLLDMVRFSPGLTLVAYSPLLSGAYVRGDLGPEFSHAGTAARLSVGGWAGLIRLARGSSRWCWRAAAPELGHFRAWSMIVGRYRRYDNGFVPR